jgi:hypothetical protein
MDLNQLRELRDHWQPPPELRRGRPRPVRLTEAGVVLMMVVVMLLVSAVCGGAWLWLRAAEDSERQRLLDQESAVTQAQVLRLRRRGEKGRTCVLDFRFTAAGRQYSRSAVIPCRTWGTLNEGDHLPVQFVVSRPEINRLSGLEGPRQLPYWVAPLVAIPLAATGTLLARYLAGRRRLLEEGRPAPGIVIQLGRKSEYGREVRYEFVTLSGGRARGKFGPVKDKGAPQPGSTIVVVYDPDEPPRNSRYPMQLVKL